MQKSILLLLVVAYLTGCQTTELNLTSKDALVDYESLPSAGEEMIDLLSGVWTTKQKMTNGTIHETIDHMNSDGTFTIEYHETYPSGRKWTGAEYGVWTISGNIHTIFPLGTIEQGERIPNHDPSPGAASSYKIITLNESEFVYESLESGNKFTARRKHIKTVDTTATSRRVSP